MHLYVETNQGYPGPLSDPLAKGDTTMAANYTVVSQKQTVSVANGTFTPVMQVTFTSNATGAVGEVDVPLTQYSVDNVKALIEARVAIMDAVHAL
jgi:hypothetical protein